MIILIAGLPGSGKSYFAEHLSQKLGYIYINSDQVRHASFGAGKYSLQDKIAVYEEMLAQTKCAIDEEKNVVADATFYLRSMREMFSDLADACNVPCYLIEVRADENTIRQRLQKPRKYSEADYSVYEKVRLEFEEITTPHLLLHSTNDNLDAMLETTISYINSERK